MLKSHPQQAMAAPRPLKPQHELFCQLYVKNAELFANATQCYAEAYGFKLDELSHERPVDAETGEQIGNSDFTIAERTCAVNGSKLLRNTKVQERITLLLNEMLKDVVVDAELAKVILQNGNPAAKMTAIREYNKIRQRITEKVDLTSNGEKITGFQYIAPNGNQDSANS
jgi:hypothetical protein